MLQYELSIWLNSILATTFTAALSVEQEENLAAKSRVTDAGSDGPDPKNRPNFFCQQLNLINSISNTFFKDII